MRCANRSSSIRSSAILAATRDAVHIGAINHLKLKQTWQQPGWIFGRDEAVLVLLFVLAFVAGYRKDKLGKYAAVAVTAGALVFIGFMANASLSLANIAGILMGYIPSLRQHPMWWIMMIGVFDSIVFMGRNIYCQRLCPDFGVVCFARLVYT